jgi:2-keto-4-pentenoate hydratase/2-oxohepta-3-ene-1,7-dioic acid hydratase in catechol pathway
MELIYAYQQNPQKDLFMLEHREPPIQKYLAINKNYARHNQNNHRGSINMNINFFENPPSIL